LNNKKTKMRSSNFR